MMITYSCPTDAVSMTTVSELRKETLPNNTYVQGECQYIPSAANNYGETPCDMILYYSGGASNLVTQTGIRDHVCVKAVGEKL